MKVSVCINTAHDDFTMIAYPNMHIFEITMASLRRQTFKDFEVVIADVLYDKRSNYFIEHPEDFPIKHVPIKDNIWIKNGYTAISTCKNTCLLHADGEIIIFMDDCSFFDKDYIRSILDLIQPGIVVTNRFAIYKGEELLGRDTRPSPPVHPIPTYGNTSMYLEDYIELNGYDEMFDGGRCLEDCDLGFRARLKGMTVKFNEYVGKLQLHEKCVLEKQGLKCPQLWWICARKRDKKKIYRANTIPITAEEFETLLSCSHRESGAICPYVHKPCNWIGKDGKCFSGIDLQNMELFKDPSLIFSLEEERNKIRGRI